MDFGKFTTLSNLTLSMNRIPVKPQRIRDMKLFSGKGLTKTFAEIEIKNNKITIIDPSPRRSSGQLHENGDREVENFHAIHLKEYGSVVADDYQDLRGFAKETALQSVSEMINDELEEMKDNFEASMEFYLMSALKGQLANSSGKIITDYYQKFGMTKQLFYFDLGNTKVNIPEKCTQLSRLIKKANQGNKTKLIHIFVGPEFFDKLKWHPSTKELWYRWKDAEFFREDMSDMFKVGNVMFEVYDEELPDKEGKLHKMVADGKGHAFPISSGRNYVLDYAPANYEETVNTKGKPYYAKMAKNKFGTARDIEAQTNPIIICTRPESLVEISDQAQPAA